MTRCILTRFIAKVGIVDASIMLHRQPPTLERWRDGLNSSTQLGK
jgi:hypothetical protein